MPDLAVSPLTRPPQALVHVPGSKSLTNRAFITAALARGTSRLTNVLFAEDTQVMIDALRSLGFVVQIDEAGATATVTGLGGHLPVDRADLFCGNSGTTIRFAAALCALGQGRYRLDGVPRMRQRPLGPLADALEQLGAQIRYEAEDGFPPIEIITRGLGGGTVTFRSPPSSQLISAVLLAAPCARSDVFIVIDGPLVSQPYVRMTLAVLDAFGVAVINEQMQRFIVSAPQSYRAREYAIEPDASAASYFLAAAAITGGTVTVEGLGTSSVQGDARFVDCLEQMGCAVTRAPSRLTVTGPRDGKRLRGIDVDLNDMPDMVQTLAVVALFAEGTTRIRNVANLRVKETDRLAALATELKRLGAEIDEGEGELAITAPRRIVPTAIDTYDDHRMAMSFALVGLRVDGIVIKDAECVGKTFPDYFTHLGRLAGEDSE